MITLQIVWILSGMYDTQSSQGDIEIFSKIIVFLKIIFSKKNSIQFKSFNSGAWN